MRHNSQTGTDRHPERHLQGDPEDLDDPGHDRDRAQPDGAWTDL